MLVFQTKRHGSESRHLLQMPWKNKEIHKAYYRVYYRNKIAKLRLERGNKCEFCNWSKVPGVLEFAHRHEFKKFMSISNLMRSKWTIVLEELKKCLLLCPTCHRIYDLKGSYPNGEDVVLKTTNP